MIGLDVLEKKLKTKMTVIRYISYIDKYRTCGLLGVFTLKKYNIKSGRTKYI